MEIVSALEKIAGRDRVATSEAVCMSYSFNCYYGKDIVMKPDIVVMVETVRQVSDVLKAANQYNVPVTPKGAVGAAGHGGPLRGGILLDLTLMDRIVLIDAVNMKAVAESGCSFFKLSQELFKVGLMLPTAAYGPGPSVAASAITPANGFGETRYGANMELVEGFEVVLPSGEVIGVGSLAYADTDFGPYYKYITGPDLTGLFTRSNGAFGIVTKVAYRCLHRPGHWAFHTYSWPSANIEGFTKALMGATANEVFDCHIRGRGRSLGAASPDERDIGLIFIVNGENAVELNGKEQALDSICRENGGTYLPGDGEEFHEKWPGDFFYLAQDRSIPGVKRPRRQAYIFDELIFPSSRLPEIYRKIVEILKKHAMWGGDGPMPGIDAFVMAPQVISWQNTIWFDDSNQDLVDRFHRAQEEFREWFGPRGGTFQYRLPPLVPNWVWTNQMGDFNLLRAIKAILDPNNILSPGTFELAREIA